MGDFKQPTMVDGQEASKFTIRYPAENSEAEVDKLMAKGVQVSAEDARASIGALLLNILPWVVMIGIWIFIIRQMQAGGASAFSFGKSKAKLLTGDTPKVTFADVAGADEAKVELRGDHRVPQGPAEVHAASAAGCPRARCWSARRAPARRCSRKAVAGEAGRPFFSMSGSDFVEMFVGVGASRVRDLFEQGKAHAPCIIFIDEIDAVGRHRGAGLGGGHDEREQTLNQLLVEMDGFESNDGVILIAATNRPDVLDPALLRPGRFDRQIVVDAPDVRGREGILRVHVRNKPARRRRRPRHARARHAGHGRRRPREPRERGARCSRRAATRPQVDMSDFEDAKDKVMLGVERRSPGDLARRSAVSPRTTRRGHAVVRDDRQGERSAAQGDDRAARPCAGADAFTLPGGRSAQLHPDGSRRGLAMAYGGRVAEELVFGRERGDDRRRRATSSWRRRSRADGDAVRDERHDRTDAGGRPRTGSLPRPRADEPPRDLGAHGAAGRRGGQAGHRHRVSAREGDSSRTTVRCSMQSPRHCWSARRSRATTLRF